MKRFKSNIGVILTILIVIAVWTLTIMGIRWQFSPQARSVDPSCFRTMAESTVTIPQGIYFKGGELFSLINIETGEELVPDVVRPVSKPAYLQLTNPPAGRYIVGRWSVSICADNPTEIMLKKSPVDSVIASIALFALIIAATALLLHLITKYLF